MENQNPRSKRISRKDLQSAAELVPYKARHIDALSVQWLRLFPWATGWQLQDLACRLHKEGLIVRQKKGWYFRATNLIESVEVKEVETKLPRPDLSDVFALAINETLKKSITPLKSFPSGSFPSGGFHGPRDLFTESEVCDKKITAIWRFVDWCFENKQRPSKELFESIFKTIAG